MPDLPSVDELVLAGRAAILDRRPDLNDFSEGSTLDAVVGAGAVQADEAIRVLLDLFAAQFVDTAEGADLDALAADRFGLTRQAASAAIGTVTLSRGSAVGSFTVPAGLELVATVDGVSVTFTTDAAVNFGALVDDVDADATCANTGRAGNVDAATITSIPEAPVADPDLTVTNAARFAGGADAESDVAFRARIRRYFSTLRRGTNAALVTGATSVPGVKFATIDESTVNTDGYVSVYIGDPEGAGNADLVDDVEAELENWRAAGVEVRVFAAERQEEPLALTLTVTRGVDRSALAQAVKAALVELGDELDSGETAYLSRIVATAHEVSSFIRGAAVTTPTSNVTPDELYSAIRFVEDDITITWVEVS